MFLDVAGNVDGARLTGVGERSGLDALFSQLWSVTVQGKECHTPGSLAAKACNSLQNQGGRSVAGTDLFRTNNLAGLGNKAIRPITAKKTRELPVGHVGHSANSGHRAPGASMCHQPRYYWRRFGRQSPTSYKADTMSAVDLEQPGLEGKPGAARHITMLDLPSPSAILETVRVAIPPVSILVQKHHRDCHWYLCCGSYSAVHRDRRPNFVV